MKSLMIYPILLLVTVFLPAHYRQPENNDTQLEILFRKTFPHIKNVQWLNVGYNKKAIVRLDGMIIHLTYSPDGILQRSLRYYQSEQLPPFILSKIYERYPSADITGITESYEETAFGYFINIRKGNKILEMHSDAFGNLSIRKQFRDFSGK